MKFTPVLLALLAGVAIGCAPSTTSSESGTTDNPTLDPAAQGPVAENDAPTTPPTDGGPGQVGTQPVEPATSNRPTVGDPPQGGQPGGQQRGGRRGGFNIASMLSNEMARSLVQKELSLTDDQVTKIQALAPAQGGGGQDVTPEERQKQRDELQKKVTAILTPAQNKRISEITLQMQGSQALTQPEVAKELGLSADQTKKIEAALDVPRPEGGQTPGGEMSAEDRQKMFEAFRKAREDANEKALAVLTPAQKTKWEKMLGKKFEMPSFQRGGGGGGAATAK